eukprot:TRINITY_DN6882_c0_g1_i1.p1 TRINITY_DN6882_c0_g1~~TRINITY_DN6882_c0_g1_i1.p1  ORF type:complete len:197 (-),score=18.22 TRINITY_DN6882_c0_g1_i1:100-690(-)
MQNYYKHVWENAGARLARCYVLYRVVGTLAQGAVVQEGATVLVMKNAFCTDNKIDEKYDLKGSTVGRKTLFNTNEADPHRKMVRISKVLLKDLDLQETHQKIRLGTERKRDFLSLLKKDCEVLQSNGIIDYSLLLGVHYLDAKAKMPPPDKYGASSDGGFYAMDNHRKHMHMLYYFTIIGNRGSPDVWDTLLNVAG